MKRVTKAVFSSGRPLRGLNLLRRLAFTEDGLVGGSTVVTLAIREAL